MLSKWHVHAEGYAKQFQAMDDVKITCVWDEDAQRGAEWAQSLGCDFVADLDELLARADVDAVAIDTPTNMHTEVMIKAANAGKHIFTEKTMALTTAECDEIIAAIEKNNVKFTISFPHRGHSANLMAKQLVDEGKLGDITLVRIRNAHDGVTGDWLPERWYDPVTTGGGAMMDLGCHPMYLSAWLLGKPARIGSMFNTRYNLATEDNAVNVIEFENKAIAIVETGFVSPHSPFIMEIYGEKGNILITGNELKFWSKDMPQGFMDYITPSRMPEALPLPTRVFVEYVLYDKTNHYTKEDGRALAELLEGAYIAHKEDKTYFF